jgi:hypothetical protein
LTGERVTGKPPVFEYKLRSLRTIKGARIELARLYRVVRAGEVDPSVGNVCRAILATLINSYATLVIDERLTAIEQRIAATERAEKARVEASNGRGYAPGPTYDGLPPQ